MLKAKQNIHSLIALAMFFILCLILPTTSGLTQTGVYSTATIVATIYLWLAVGTGWPSILGIGLAIIFNSLGSTPAVFASSLGTIPILYAILVLMLNNALVDSGITTHVAYWFITRKIVKGRPKVFVLLFTLSAWLLGLFLDGSVIIILYLALTTKLCEVAGYEKSDNVAKLLAFGSFSAVSFAYAATPIGHVVPVMMMTMIQTMTGVTVSMLEWCLFGVPISFVTVIAMVPILFLIAKPDFSKFDKYDATEDRKQLAPINRDGKITIYVFLLVVILWLFPDVGQAFLPDVSNFLRRVTVVVPTMLGVITLCLFRKKDSNEPIMNYYTTLQKVPFNIVLFVSCIQLFAVMVNSEITGIRPFMMNLFSPLTAALSPMAIVALAIFATIILTNFFSNAVIQAVVYTVFAPALLDVPGNPVSVVAFGVFIGIATNFAIMTPSASGLNPFLYDSGYVKTSDGFRLGMPVCIAAWVVFMVFWPLANAMFK